MSRKSAVSDAHGGNLRKCGLERSEELGFELAVNFASGVASRYVAADVFVKEHRVRKAVAVFAEAADSYIHIKTDVLVNDSERYGACGSVLVADYLLGVEVIDSLVGAGVSAEGETLLEHLPGAFEVVAEVSVEDGRLGGFIPDELARLCAELDNRSLLHYHHALSFVDGDDGAVGNDVVGSLGVGASVSDPLLPFHDENVARKRVTIEILSPLIAQKARYRLFCCLYKSHLCTPLSNIFGLSALITKRFRPSKN